LRDSKDCTATKKTTARTARLAEQQDRKKKKEKTRRKRTGIVFLGVGTRVWKL